LTCLKRVKDTSLASLERVVNNDLFSLSFIISLGEAGLKKYIQHLGLGNKNAEEILALFVNIKTFMDANGYFPHSITQLTENKGVGTKIASLVVSAQNVGARWDCDSHCQSKEIGSVVIASIVRPTMKQRSTQGLI